MRFITGSGFRWRFWSKRAELQKPEHEEELPGSSIAEDAAQVAIDKERVLRDADRARDNASN